jgi:hypothetical protein
MLTEQDMVYLKHKLLYMDAGRKGKASHLPLSPWFSGKKI